ncbi:hypothetical protein GGF50DRAFT_54669 [Schizophyllum commune]
MPSVQDLPAELLAEIFLHCAPRDRDALYSRQGVNWVAPSQVCSQWRLIALACKRFWASSIPFKPPYWTHTALRRARDAPLAFNIDLSQSEMQHCATTVALHTEQLVELAISGSRWEIKEMLALFVQDSAPRLEVLSLKVESPYDHLRAPCLPDVFQGHTLQPPPLLRTLELDFCYLPLTSNLYAGVTTFVLRYPSPLWGVGFVHDLLRTMPQLQSLCLASVYDMPLITPGQVLVLPRSLVSMRFVASPRAPSLWEQGAFGLFLQSLKFTAESWVVMCEVAELLHTVPVLHSFHDYVGSSPVGLELDVERSYEDEGTVAETLGVRLQSGTGSQCKAIVLSVISPSSSIAEALRRPLEMLRPLRVVDFSARGYFEDDNSECGSYASNQPLWWNNNMPHVTNWTVDALPPAFLLEGLLVRRMLSIGVDTRFCDRRAVCDEDGHVIQIFPNLQSIRLVGVDLCSPLVGYYKARVVERGASVLPLILMVVWACAERQRLKFPDSHVPRISIRDCKGVDVGIVHALRGLTSVEWDGKGRASWTDYKDVRTAVLEEYIEMFAAEDRETVRVFPMPVTDENSAGSSSLA